MRVHFELERQAGEASGKAARLRSACGDGIQLLTFGACRAGHHVISFVLPALNGLRRAYAQASLPTTWPSNANGPSLPPLDDMATSQLSVTFAAAEWDDGTDAARITLATLEIYEGAPLLISGSSSPASRFGTATATTSFAGPAISPATKALANLELQQAYWSSVLIPTPGLGNDQRWARLQERNVVLQTAGDANLAAAAKEVGEQAVAYWQAELVAVEEDRADQSATEVLIGSLVRSHRRPPGLSAFKRSH